MPVAAELAIGHPRTYRIADVEQASSAELDYPVILKPAMKEGVNALTAAKAWRVDTRDEFLLRFSEGLSFAGAGGLVVQELIPDDGSNQFSYCAFCVEGEPPPRHGGAPHQTAAAQGRHRHLRRNPCPPGLRGRCRRSSCGR